MSRADDRAQLALDAAGMRAWAWDILTNEVSWSDGIEDLFGAPPGAFDGTFHGFLSFVHPEDRAHVQEVIARTLERGDDYEVAHRVVRPGGEVRWVSGRGQVFRGEDGRPIRMTGVVWDATARKKHEARLARTLRLYALVSAINKQIVRVRSEGELFESACRIAVEQGHFRFAWIGKADALAGRMVPVAHAGVEEGYLEDVVLKAPPSTRQRGPVGSAVRLGRHRIFNDLSTDPEFEPWREAALRRGYRSCAAFPLRCGERIVAGMAIYADEAGCFDAQEVELLLGLADDIGAVLQVIESDEQRRAAEAAVRASEERYRTLVEQASDAIFLCDADSVILEVNGRASELAGYAREELLGKRLSELLVPEQRAASPYLLRGEPPGKRGVGERKVVRKDERVIDVEISAAVLADGRVQGIARDVTERKLLQQEMAATERMASLGRLAAGVAHEVNNPLAYITLNLERILDELGDAETKSALRRAASEALDGAARVRQIVRALLSLARKDDEPTGPVDVHRALDAAIQIASARIRQRGRLITTYGATRAARASELQLGQVFVNLLVNAADALDPQRAGDNEITVRTRDAGDRVVIEVTDSGTGIPPELIERVFDPFFTTKPVGEGTGLGLAVSHGIVAAFGGEITVESVPGKKTTFRVSLPVIAVPRPAEPRPSPPPASARRARVLIVDDEPRLANALKHSLDDHEVTLSFSADDALARCRSASFDCVFCDLMMPGMSGMDLLRALHEDGGGVERRIVFMTGGAYTEGGREFLDSVENRVLEKPFARAALVDALESVLRAEGPAHA